MKTKNKYGTIFSFLFFFLFLMVWDFLGAQQIVHFKDGNFEDYIKDLVGKNNHDTIFVSDMETIKNISINNGYITDITGIEFAKNLESLNLVENDIQDFSPIRDLKKLAFLNISRNHINQKTDILNLTGLRGFDPEVEIRIALQENHMSDSCLRPLRGITNLTSLDLKGSGEFSVDSVYAITENTKLKLKNSNFTARGLGIPYKDALYRASYIEEVDTNLFHLKGDIFILRKGGWLRFRLYGGILILDKRHRSNEKLQFNGKVYMLNYKKFEGSPKKAFNGAWLLMDGALKFNSKISQYNYQYDLILAEPFGGIARLGSYNFKIYKLDLQRGVADIVFNKKILPFPLNHSGLDGFVTFDTAGLKMIRAKTNDLTVNFGSSAINSLSISYSFTEFGESTIGGTTNIRIPGYTHVADYFNGTKWVHGSGYELLEIGTDMAFHNGQLDKLLINSSADIPLGTTGLSISKIIGGIDNFSSKNWNLVAKVDIETGIEIPGIGSPIGITDFGVRISPFINFEGSGSFELFKTKVANGKINYNHNNRKLEIKGNVNLGNILIGNLNGSLAKQNLTGVITGKIHTPKKLPWGFGWASDKDLTYCEATLNNEIIRTAARIWRFNIAQEIKFSNPSFPYFHYSIGRNYESLTQILKSSLQDEFTVKPEVPMLLVVAGNEKEPIDFSLTSPSGIVYNSDNTDYNKFELSKQTVMGIPSPESGTWKINTENYQNVKFEAMEQYRLPYAEFVQPLVPDNPDHSIKIKYSTDDSIQISIYIDDDRKGFDGRLFLTYGNLAKGQGLTGSRVLYRPFDYYGLEPAEYFVYYVMDDGKNAPVKKYAPGSFNYFKKKSLNYIPQGLSYSIVDDTLHFRWDQPSDTAFNTTLYFYNLSDNTKAEYSLDEGIDSLVIDSIFKPSKYLVYAKFTTIGYIPYYGHDFISSENSDTLEINYKMKNDTSNHAPYFITNGQIKWNLFEGKESSIAFNVFDIDSNKLTISLLEDVKNLNLSGKKATWIPSNSQEGYHLLHFIVSDKQLNDTLVVLANVKQSQLSEIKIKVEHNQANNEYILIQISNNEISNPFVTAHLYNPANGKSETITCNLVSEGTYEANFSVERMNTFGNLNDKVTISYQYNNQEVSTSFTIESVTDVEENGLVDLKLNVFPNPAKSTVYITHNAIGTVPPEIIIYNLQGRIFYRSIPKTKYSTINVRNWGKGIYFVKLIDSQQVILKKIVKF